MAKKYEYDSDDFYKKLYTLCLQGCTDREIADSLKINPSTLSRMKNGKYQKWTKEQNAIRSKRIIETMSRGRVRINAIVRSAYLKAALGGKKVKKSIVKYVQERCECEGKNKRCPYCGGTGWVTLTDKAVAQEEVEELYPNVQAMSMWLLHHDEEWRKIERKQDNEDGLYSENGIDIDKWMEDNTSDE